MFTAGDWKGSPSACVEIKFYGAFVLNHPDTLVDFHTAVGDGQRIEQRDDEREHESHAPRPGQTDEEEAAQRSAHDLCINQILAARRSMAWRCGSYTT